VKYEREHKTGTLTYDFGYHVSDVEKRLVRYGRPGALYQPDYLRFTVTSTSEDIPGTTGLEITKIVLSGCRLNKNGEVGALHTSERIYSYEYDKLPEWVMPLIQYAIKEVQASLCPGGDGC
jgi:hypothetical protein